MVSDETIKISKALADKYVVGAKQVGDLRRSERDYKGYVKDLAPLIDDCLKSLRSYVAERNMSDLTTFS